MDSEFPRPDAGLPRDGRAGQVAHETGDPQFALHAPAGGDYFGPPIFRIPFIRLPAMRTPAIVLAGLLLLAGCGGNRGVQRYDLSGQVKYDGKIVPRGYLRFVPDKKQGNRGPGASATILDGNYKTLPGMGSVGGPHLIKIVGTDGIAYRTKEGAMIPIGRPLFPEYEVRVDLPKEVGTTHDFNLPAISRKKKRSR